ISLWHVVGKNSERKRGIRSLLLRSRGQIAIRPDLQGITIRPLIFKNILFGKIDQGVVPYIQKALGTQITIVIIPIIVRGVFVHTADMHIPGSMYKLIVPYPHAYMDYPFLSGVGGGPAKEK